MTREATKEKLKKVASLIESGNSLSTALKEAGLSAATYYNAKGDAGRKKAAKLAGSKPITRKRQPVSSEKITVIIGSPEQIRAYLG